MGTRHLQAWPTKVPHDLTLPDTSLWYNLEVSATRYPNKPCTVFYESVLSYGELRRDAERLAGFLQKECGVQRGDRVALFMQNAPQFVVAYYAVLRADAVVVPINPMNQTPELAYMLKDSGARVLIAAQDLVAQLTPLLDADPQLRAIVTAYSDYLTSETTLKLPDNVSAPRAPLTSSSAHGFVEALQRELTPLPHRAGPADLCVMPYTSGTTGHPKGCMHTHRSVMHTAVAGATMSSVTTRKARTRARSRAVEH